MPVQLNHTIVAARDKDASANFLAEILGLANPQHWGPFVIVQTDNDLSLDFMDASGEIASQHYAFLVGDGDFDGIFERVKARGLTYYPGPSAENPGHINTRDGGRGFYFADPSGHWLEVLTRPYGSEGRTG